MQSEGGRTGAFGSTGSTDTTKNKRGTGLFVRQHLSHVGAFSIKPQQADCKTCHLLIVHKNNYK